MSVEYEIVGDHAVVTGCGERDFVFEIDSVYEGYTVTEIKEAAFRNKRLLRVIIPETIHTIGAYAFDSCIHLNYLGTKKDDESGWSEFPACVKEIGAFAFRNSGLEYVRIMAEDISIGEEGFADCLYLNRMDLPNAKRLALGSGLFINACIEHFCAPHAEVQDVPEYLFYNTDLKSCVPEMLVRKETKYVFSDPFFTVTASVEDLPKILEGWFDSTVANYKMTFKVTAPSGYANWTLPIVEDEQYADVEVLCDLLAKECVKIRIALEKTDKGHYHVMSMDPVDEDGNEYPTPPARLRNLIRAVRKMINYDGFTSRPKGENRK